VSISITINESIVFIYYHSISHSSVSPMTALNPRDLRSFQGSIKSSLFLSSSIICYFLSVLIDGPKAMVSKFPISLQQIKAGAAHGTDS
jgi:hypothetical protein